MGAGSLNVSSFGSSNLNVSSNLISSLIFTVRSNSLNSSIISVLKLKSSVCSAGGRGV